jgi:hypothetical protein
MRLRFEVQGHDDFNDPEEAGQQIAIASTPVVALRFLQVA